MSKLLRIIPPNDADGVTSCNGTRFVLDDGTEVPHVTKCVITYEADAVLVATIDVAIHADTVTAQPMLSLECLKEAAEFYGYALIPRPWWLRWLTAANS